MKIPTGLKFTGKDSSIKGIEKQRLMNALYEKLKIQQEFNSKAKQDFSGVVPSVFVGEYGYPQVNAGFLSSEEYKENDNPLLWSREGSKKYDIIEIIKLRSSLLNSKFSVNAKVIKNIDSRLNQNLREISLSKKPVEAEVNLEKAPYFGIYLEKDLLPHGPSAPLKKITISENPKIPILASKFESDTDLKASSAITTLYKRGFDEHYITRILTAGNLGVKEERKIVPTKWSITAVDDTLGKKISLSEIRDFNEHDLACFIGGYMGNYYIALIFPGPWSYELYETYVGPGLQNPSDYESASDYEDALGRSVYAHNTVGGYYASRLAVLDYLKSVKKKGRVLMLRFITDEYWAPLGVWVVREASRKTMASPALAFDSESRMLSYARLYAMKKYNLDLSNILKKSKLISEMRIQKPLSYFFNI